MDKIEKETCIRFEDRKINQHQDLVSLIISTYRTYNSHKPNIHDLNSDIHTLFLSILILNSQCVGVAIEGMDILYMGLIFYKWKSGALFSYFFLGRISQFNLIISERTINSIRKHRSIRWFKIDSQFIIWYSTKYLYQW